LKSLLENVISLNTGTFPEIESGIFHRMKSALGQLGIGCKVTFFSRNCILFQMPCLQSDYGFNLNNNFLPSSLLKFSRKRAISPLKSLNKCFPVHVEIAHKGCGYLGEQPLPKGRRRDLLGIPSLTEPRLQGSMASCTNTI